MEDENTDIFPTSVRAISGHQPQSPFRQSSPGYTGYTDYVPYLPTRSSPLRTSTTFHNSRPKVETWCRNDEERYHQSSSPPRMPLSSPIRGIGHSHCSSGLFNSSPIEDSTPPLSRIDFFKQNQDGKPGLPASRFGSCSNGGDRFQLSFRLDKPTKKVPFQNREMHLNPFQRGQGGLDKHRRQIFLRKLREGKTDERRKERVEKSLALEFWSDTRQEREIKQREASRYAVSDPDLDNDVPVLGARGGVGGSAGTGGFSIQDTQFEREQQLLREMELREQEELERLIEMAERTDGDPADTGGGRDLDDGDDEMTDDAYFLDFDVDDAMNMG